MSKVEGGSVQLTPPPPKASCNYFFFEASRVNCDKSKVLRIYRSLHRVVHQYILDGTVLESIRHHPYLGIELTSNLNWGKHISNIVGKANRTLGTISLDKISENIQNLLKTRPILH